MILLDVHDRDWMDSDCNTTKKGGGLGIFINNILRYSENTYSYLNRSMKDIEAQWVALLQKKNKVILLCNVYRPPQGNIETFLDTIDNILSELD